jgi:hypothetical protein
MLNCLFGDVELACDLFTGVAFCYVSDYLEFSLYQLSHIKCDLFVSDDCLTPPISF